MATPALSEIPAFLEIGTRLGTSGYPSRDQFGAILDAGYSVVINLATPASKDWLADEAELLGNLGLVYHERQVNWQAPQLEDFKAFCALMAEHRNQRVFVHCQANMRVSAFMFLYRVKVLGENRTEAEGDLQRIWKPNEIWSKFIQDVLNS